MKTELKNCGIIPATGEIIFVVQVITNPHDLMSFPKIIQDAVCEELCCKSVEGIKEKVSKMQMWL